jgi:pimeloyl-ACP methyl ester carboxylesterase
LILLALALSLADSLPRRPVEVAVGEYLNTVSVGTGPAVVMLNGLVGGAYGFRRIMGEVSQLGYHVVAVEPLGLGESSRPKKADYSLSAQAGRIAQVLDTLGVKNAVILAHSLGAALAFRLAYQRPDLVSGILSIDGGPEESAAPAGLKRAMRWAGILKIFVGRGRIRSEVRKELLDASRDSSWLTTEVLDGYTDGPTRDVGATIDAFRGMVRAVEPEPLRDRLWEIRVPVRLLIGASPHNTGVDTAGTDLMRRVLPDFAVDSVAGSGQLVHEEQPEVVVNAVLAMMKLTKADSVMQAAMVPQ